MDMEEIMHNLPKSFLEQYKKFEQWHFDKRSKLVKKGDRKLEFLEESFPTWEKEFRDQIDEMGVVTSGFRADERAAIKKYIENSDLYKAYLRTPYYKQIIEKPRGYAGDPEMLRIIYRNDFEGSDVFEKLIHRLATECDAAVAVRNRRLFLKEQIQQAEGNILSLAAGPAAEIFDTIELTKNGTRNSFVALDHDIETLKEVREKDSKNQIEYGLINAFHLIKGKKEFLVPRERYISNCDPSKDSKGLGRLLIPLKYKIRKLEKENYKLIYTAGLYDYIRTSQTHDKGTVALTKCLFDLLKPGGKLIIGNFSNNNPIGIRWVMEFICDWFLIHRTEEEILEFASGIKKEALGSIEVIKEEKGINSFLVIQKKENHL